MNLKQNLLATAIFTMTTTSVSVLAETPVADTFSTSEIVSLFEQDTQPLQLAALSGQEMKETEGAWGPWGAAIGGVSELAGYTAQTMISGEPWSWTQATLRTGAGAVQGALAGPVGVAWVFNRHVGTGAAIGVAKQYLRSV